MQHLQIYTCQGIGNHCCFITGRSLDSIEAVRYWLAETDPLREQGVVTDHGTERAVTVVLKRFYCMESYE